ncbi:MAG: FIG002283: Isochorismatase family protein [uncultured Cytophagales bacterium]|uniref:FIG002283: Isochorismatase family protein n=1 Tax=uncultured Cytophagales bacterium TaxID=158755 RepID=A0A6J4LU84_9SPHI|nr:MAG: FIG002283: Isochorismatase family protein [uncultured Cytophagales bacterium]
MKKLTCLLLLAVFAGALPARAQKPSPKLLTPDNCVVLLIDHQPQMGFSTKNIEMTLLRNNLAGLSKATQLFKVPVVLTTVAESFAGAIWPEIKSVFPNNPIIERTTMNSWEDPRVVEAIRKTGRKKIVLAGLWTQVCGAFVALSAIDEGFEVYFVTDASGDVSREIHDSAVQRMVQAGTVPVNWLQVMLEWQRDWARKPTYEGVNQIVMQHGGTYGLGVIYGRKMLGANAGEGKSSNGGN